MALGSKGISGITVAYAIPIFFLSLILLGFLLVVVSENMLGIHVNALASQQNVDGNLINWFEALRNILGLAVLIGLVIGALAMAYLGGGA